MAFPWTNLSSFSLHVFTSLTLLSCHSLLTLLPHSPFKIYSHLCTDRTRVQFMLDSFPHCNSYFWLNSVLPTLTSIQLCLSLMKGTLLPCYLCISHVCAMFVHGMGSMPICWKNEWIHTVSIHCGTVIESSVYKTHSPHLQPLMYSFPMLAHGSTASEFHFSALPECHSWVDFCHDLTHWTSLDWSCSSFPPQNTYLSKMTILFQAWPLSEFAGRMDFTGTMTHSRLWVPNLKLNWASLSSCCNEHWQKCDLLVQEYSLRGFLSYQVALTKEDSDESSVKESESKGFNFSWNIWWFHGEGGIYLALCMWNLIISKCLKQRRRHFSSITILLALSSFSSLNRKSEKVYWIFPG